MAAAWGLILVHLLERPHILTLPIMVLWFAALFAGEALLAAPNRAARLVAVKRWGLFGAASPAASLLTLNGFAGW